MNRGLTLKHCPILLRSFGKVVGWYTHLSSWWDHHIIYGVTFPVFFVLPMISHLKHGSEISVFIELPISSQRVSFAASGDPGEDGDPAEWVCLNMGYAPPPMLGNLIGNN